MVYDITSRLESFSLNTVVSGFMEYNNKMIDLAKKEGGIDKETLETAVILLAPFAPHLCEELWSQLGHTPSVLREQHLAGVSMRTAMAGRRDRDRCPDQRQDQVCSDTFP